MRRSRRAVDAAAAAVDLQRGLRHVENGDNTCDRNNVFPFTCQLTGLLTEPVTMWDATRLARLPPGDRARMSAAIDGMGHLSMIAQGISAPVTSVHHLRSTSQRLYIYAEQRVPIGLLKVGVKRLFVRDRRAHMYEIEPLCILDFYVHESRQRSGVGRTLFQYMLAEELIRPARLAYDRPSAKFLAFLSKHYGLSSYTQQSNNFVVFDDYYAGTPRAAMAAADSPASTPRQASSGAVVAGGAKRQQLQQPKQQQKSATGRVDEAREADATAGKTRGLNGDSTKVSAEPTTPTQQSKATRRSPFRTPFVLDDEPMPEPEHRSPPRHRPFVLDDEAGAAPGASAAHRMPVSPRRQREARASAALQEILSDLPADRVRQDQRMLPVAPSDDVATATMPRRNSGRNISSFIFDEGGTQIAATSTPPAAARFGRRSTPPASRLASSSSALQRITSPPRGYESPFFSPNPDKVTNIAAAAWYSPLGGVRGHTGGRHDDAPPPAQVIVPMTQRRFSRHSLHR